MYSVPVPTFLRHGRWVPLGQFIGETQQEDDRAELRFVGQNLKRIREKLLQTDAVIRRSQAAAKEVGPDLGKAWQKYTLIVSNYQRMRVLIGLKPEPGLSGILGAIVVGGLTIAGLAALIAALLVGAGALLERAMEAEKQKEALSKVVAKQAGAPAGARYTTVTDSSGKVYVVPEEQGAFEWIVANPGTTAMGVVGLFFMIQFIRGR